MCVNRDDYGRFACANAENIEKWTTEALNDIGIDDER